MLGSIGQNQHKLKLHRNGTVSDLASAHYYLISTFMFMCS